MTQKKNFQQNEQNKFRLFVKKLFTNAKVCAIISVGLLLGIVYGPAPFGKNPCVARAFHPHNTLFWEYNFKKGEDK